jgi:renalase
MNTMNAKKTYDVIIIGAGISGITAANQLKKNGLSVIILDKGKGIGGRLATKRIQNGNDKIVFDYGAKFIEGDSPEFQEVLSNLLENNIIKEWQLVNDDKTESNTKGRKKYIGIKSIREIALFLSKGLEILNDTKAVKVSWTNGIWETTTGSGETYNSKNLLLTLPVPQAMDLLENSKIFIPADKVVNLKKVAYNRCIVAMLTLGSSSLLKLEGGVQIKQEPISFITDNNLKGINRSKTAVTVEMTNSFSHRNWEENDDEIAKKIIELSSPWIGSKVIDYKIHKWKYSQPAISYDKRFEIIDEQKTFYLAGDAFLGNNVESAYLSGLSASLEIQTKFSQQQIRVEQK